MQDNRFTAKWVKQARAEWRQESLASRDLKEYRTNYDIPGWYESEYRNSLPFGSCLAIERLCCEVERLNRELRRVIDGQ